MTFFNLICAHRANKNKTFFQLFPPPFSYNSFLTWSQEAKFSGAIIINFFPPTHTHISSVPLELHATNFWTLGNFGTPGCWREFYLPESSLPSGSSGAGSASSFGATLLPALSWRPVLVSRQTPLIYLFVSLKSHNRAAAPGLLRRSNRSPLLQKAPLDRWLMGAGVEAQVLSETPAEVEGGWFAGMDTSPTFLSCVAAPSDSAQRALIGRGAGRSGAVGALWLDHPGSRLRWPHEVNSSCHKFFLKYTTFNDVH